MSVDSGLSGPVEGPVPSATPRAGTPPRVAQSRTTRRGPAAADALADAVSTPSFRTGRGRPRRRGRRVTRIVRRIELWSVLKIALVFNTILLGVMLGAVALLWGLANTTGLVDDLEGFLRDAGFEDFRFQGERMFEQVAFIGAVGALATTVFMVLATALLNLISEITGARRFVVIEEIVETPAAPVRPPTPLALPTAPPAAPPAPMAPPVVEPPFDDAAPSPTPPAAAAPAAARRSPDGAGRSGGARKTTSTAKPRSRSGGPSRPAAAGGPGSPGGSRRVRRPAPAADRPKDEADDTATGADRSDEPGPDDSTTDAADDTSS